MLFNSLHFLIFFPIILILYFSIPHKFRWMVLLAGSYYFYMSWKAEYIILIMISTLVDYIAGIQIYNAQSKLKKKIFLGLSLFINLGLLFTFKYFNFFSESTRELLNHFAIPMDPITLKVLLPIGISFYTFQTISYTIDIYRGKIKPEKHLGIFAVYVSFFPQLVAGPILRARDFLPQFYVKHKFEYVRAVEGARLILWGFFKKMVIADTLATTVNMIYATPSSYSGPYLIIATVFFAIQIYCDFSGYTDIAIGAARMMGFNLKQNFRAPYLSKSIGEFWKRWHISLSTWFRDYVYIPLKGNRVSVPRWYFNILITFIVSGLWHGSSFNFIIWGLLHGLYLIVEITFQPITSKIKINHYVRRFLAIAWTFILVNIGWVFFRADSISDAVYILTHMFTNIGEVIIGGVLIFVVIFILFIMDLIYTNQKMILYWNRLNKVMLLRWLVYIGLVLELLLFGINKSVEFVYFQF